jgi:quercetin dioxygenase-like cupin family protein
MNRIQCSLAVLSAAAATCGILATASAQEPAAPAAQTSTPAEPPLAITPDDPKLQWSPCPPLFPQGCQIAVLHGDPAQPNADVFFRVPGGYAIPAHWHTSAERMALVSGELEVRYAGQPSATLKKGDYAYGPAKAPHEARCLSKEPCTLFIAFESAVDAHAVDKLP